MMSTFYADTSAAVKLYVHEVGSDWFRNQVSLVFLSATSVCTTPLLPRI